MSSYPSFQTQTTRQLNELQAQVRPQAIAPNHLIKLCRTVEVSSLLEMREALPRTLMSDIRLVTRVIPSDRIFFYDPVTQKFVLSSPPFPFVWYNHASFVAQHNTFRVGVSYSATTEELLKETKYSEDYLKNILFYIVDIKEAQLLHRILAARSIYVLATPQSFIGALAYLKTVLLNLESGSENFYFLVPSNLNFHIMREAPPRLGAAHNFYTHAQKGQNHYVPFTQSNSADPTRNYIVAYSDYLVKTTTRYVLERFYIEHIDQPERDLYRIVAERYVSYEFPPLFGFAGGFSAVQTWAASIDVTTPRNNINLDELPPVRDLTLYENYINSFW